jgi:geranylgeranyl diphosphate synthase type I
MIEGQYLDMSFEQFNSITIGNYLGMIERKTGALIQSAMFIGALVGSRNQVVAEAFGDYGNLLGLAFQIRDDYLGIWGNPNVTGKPVGSDILRKKKSLPVVHAFQEAKGESLRRLKGIYSSDQISENDLTDVLDIMEELGSSSFVNNMAQSHASAAIEKLAVLNLDAGARSQLESVSTFFVTRDH